MQESAWKVTQQKEQLQQREKKDVAKFECFNYSLFNSCLLAKRYSHLPHYQKAITFWSDILQTEFVGQLVQTGALKSISHKEGLYSRKYKAQGLLRKSIRKCIITLHNNS